MAVIATNHPFRRLIVIFLIIILCVSFLVFNFCGIVVFSINHLTGYTVTYDRSGGNPLGKSVISGLRLVIEKTGFTLNADKAYFDFKALESLSQRRLILDCDLEGVEFVGKEGGESVSSGDNILAVPFSAGQKYEKVTFSVLLDNKALEVSGFNADSRNVRMSGSCVFLKKKNDITLELKISFSPEISNTLPEAIRDNTLSPDEGGWYSTVISYKGNVIMLRALYSLTA